MSAIIETRGLTRHFAGITANEDVNFTLPEGEIRALIGPNGAGKTTFTSMLIGRLTPSAGSIHFQERDITALPAHARVRAGMAYTFQITSVFQRLSVFENVALAARQRQGARPREIAGIVSDVLARVGLEGRDDSFAADLSYGHQRLLEIAMGLAQDPKVLILDEPTQGLSAGEVAAFSALVRSLVPDTTVLLIEHNMTLVMDLATSITVLDMGRVLAEGSPAEIHADKAVQTAYLGGG